MPDEPTVVSVLRDAAFEALIDNADQAASYSRSLAEAAFRGDALTVEVHIRQLRALIVAMIQTYKDYLDGEGMAEAGSSRPDGAGEQAGDGVGRDQPEAALGLPAA